MKQENTTHQIKMIMQQKINQLLTEDPWSRATLAKLRRGIGKQPGDLPELYEIVLSNIPEELYGKEESISYPVWAIYTALTLFALHQQGKDRPMSISSKGESNMSGNSLGAAVGHLVKQDLERENSIKRRFDSVVTSNEFTEFAHHARGLIQLLKAGDISLDYPRFAVELYRYQFDEIRNQIRLSWGEDYYRTVQSKNKNEDGGSNNGQQ